MNSLQREQLRLSLLRFLDDNASPRGMSAALLLQLARSEGRSELELREIRTELQYLADKGLVVTLPKTLSPEIALWRVTANGRDHLAQANE